MGKKQFRVAVVGAGHAGVEAAFTLAKGGAKVTLFSDEPVLPYHRPSLAAVAFGQTAPDSIAIKPEVAYVKAGIDLRYEAATEIDFGARTVNGDKFNILLLATGSRPVVPPFKGELGRIHTLWSLADALAIRETAAPGKALTVIGGGFVGLEAALRATEAGLRVTVVESSPGLVKGLLGGGEPTLRRMIEDKGIKVNVGAKVTAITAGGVRLADGREIEDDLLLCATGVRPTGIPGDEAPLYACGDLNVALYPNIYTAGDVALTGRLENAQPYVPCRSARRASQMGQLLGESLLFAYLGGNGTYLWSEPILPISTEVGDVGFCILGDVLSKDLEERRVDNGDDPHVWTSVLWRGELPVGMRWIGTHAGFDAWAPRICESLAEPPLK